MDLAPYGVLALLSICTRAPLTIVQRAEASISKEQHGEEADLMNPLDSSLEDQDSISDEGKVHVHVETTAADKAKKKLPKWNHAKVVDQVGELSATVAAALPALMNSLANAQQKPKVEDRLAKLQEMFQAGIITASEMAAGRAACLSSM